MSWNYVKIGWNQLDLMYLTNINIILNYSNWFQSVLTQKIVHLVKFKDFKKLY